MEKRVILIDEKILQQRINQLAEEITADYEGEEITLIAVLKGSVFFFTDLARRIKLDTRLEFCKTISYEDTESTGEVIMEYRPKDPVTGKNVIIVEDIFDTGYTLSYLYKEFSKEQPKSIKLCALLDKPERREVHDVELDYTGFVIKNHFVVGYGLDLNQKYRNLPNVEYFTKESEEEVKADVENIEKQLLKVPRWKQEKKD
jgi:hypoxanthine phosphoribosyltransferase